jgi:hypothetical protein
VHPAVSVCAVSVYAQVRIPATGGRLFIASDGLWDAFPPSKAVPKVRRIGSADCGPTLFARIVERYGDYMDDTTLIGAGRAGRVKMRTDPTAADGHALHEVMGWGGTQLSNVGCVRG